MQQQRAHSLQGTQELTVNTLQRQGTRPLQADATCSGSLMTALAFLFICAGATRVYDRSCSLLTVLNPSDFAISKLSSSLSGTLQFSARLPSSRNTFRMRLKRTPQMVRTLENLSQALTKCPPRPPPSPFVEILSATSCYQSCDHHES